MAQVKRKSEWQVGEQPAIMSVEQGLSAHGPSPARVLQQLLAERTGVQVDVERWSRRRSLALIVAGSSALWLALLTMAQTAASFAA